MVNLTHQELKETQVAELPNASISALRKMREDACASTSSSNFKLQAQQRFLRRVLSPDAPTQNLLMAHGTGTGKTCTAIQIAEEYILRPEFQSKKVLVIANPSVQDNFKNQIFDISRVNVDADGLLLSKQCTGRRYLEILQRAQAQPLRWTDQNSRQKLVRQASRILNEFYDFQGYAKFGNLLNDNKNT
jgi:type I site-specific restriction endonuclease